MGVLKVCKFFAKKWEFEEMGILPSVLHADPEWESDWPRVYASRLKKTVCSVLEKILSGREQITISDSLRTDLKPAAYLNLNFSNVQIWRKPNDGLVYGQTDPIVSQCELFVFCAWWYASGHEFPGNALYDQFVSFFARNVFTVARLVTIIALKVKFWCVFVATARSSLGDQATAQMLDTQSFVGKSG